LLPLAVAPQATQAAGTSTGAMSVTATVLDSCSVIAAPLAFGSYASTAAVLATSTLTINCSNSTSYTVGLDLGQGTGATVASRKMVGPQTTDLLNYQLFSDSARSVAWGPTVGTNTVAGVGTGVSQSLTVYGRIPAGQLLRAGAYTDTVSVLVTY